jgi:putative two-component system response regulator
VQATEQGRGRILVVDDQESNVLLLVRILRNAGYEDVASTTDPRAVPDLFSSFRPDIVLLDLHMPHLDGHQVMALLDPLIPHDAFLPVLVLTADVGPAARERSLSQGAKDFLTKPFDPTEVVLRVRNLLQTRFLHLALQRQNHVLEERVRERTMELEDAQFETFERLAMAAEYRDDATGRHTRRVGNTSATIAAELELPADEVEVIRYAAGLHDIGKIGIPDAILQKPARLTAEEFAIVRIHTKVGAGILSNSRTPLLRMAEVIALTHHERWDGDGYAGLRGEEIPLVGRITTVADVYDALLQERPYKRAWALDEALSEIVDERGRQFAPDVVDAFLRAQERGAFEPAQERPA